MPPDGIIRYLHAAYAGPDGVTDAELLRRCAKDRDDAAFELLMRRHAALVWRVCRSVTRDGHIAEDAFQATFLALARHATKVSGTVVGWLARVGYHAALRARARQASVDCSSEPVPDQPMHADPAEAAARSELDALLHDELNRLADAYRLPLVLCYLEGLSHAEAAKTLGWPIGTVATRIARGRDRLRDRLTRRGVALPAGVAAALSAGEASAVPLPVMAVAVRAIRAGTIPPHVQHLTTGVLSAMTRPKKLMTALAVAIVFAAGAAITFGGKPETLPAEPPEPPTVPEKGGPGDVIIVMYDRGGAPRVARIADQGAIASLEKCFTNYRKRPVSNTAGGWKMGAEVFFNFPYGNTVRVVVAPEPVNDEQVDWSVGRGDFKTASDFYKLAARLVKEAASPVGDESAAWSATVKGLKARLLLQQAYELNGTPILTTYLELNNVSGSAAPIVFRWGDAKKTWGVTDFDGAEVPRYSGPVDETKGPDPVLIIPNGSTLRFDARRSSTGVGKDLAAHLDLGPDDTWNFIRGARKRYFLAGTVTIEGAKKDEWSGTLVLPKVRIPLAIE
jgi:RNA polymerase sigma factor (sigma-70 family)